MSERLNKTSICCIVFLDIVAYSQKSVSEQLACKDRFNRLIGDAIKDVAQNDRIILDTGDGAAIAMLGSPEDAVFVSMTIRDGILSGNREHPESPLFVRIGINLGPVRVVKDINDRVSIIGDGINVAQRIMSFAEPNHILVSRSYYEIVSRLSDELTQIFTYSGIKHDKHVREHEVYAIRSNAVEMASPGAPAASETELGSDAGADRAKRRKMAIGGGVLALLVALGVLISRPKSPAQGSASAVAESSRTPAASSTPTSVPAANTAPDNAAASAPKAEPIAAPLQNTAASSSKHRSKNGTTSHKRDEATASPMTEPAKIETPRLEPVHAAQTTQPIPPVEPAKTEPRHEASKPVSQHHSTKGAGKDVDCSPAMLSLHQCH